MNIKKLVLGYLDTNVYILTKDKEAIIIDPADDFDTIKKELKDYKLVGCLLTHYHPDHMGALEEVLSYYDLEINKVKSNKFEFEMIPMPGHTRDSVIFYFKDDKIMFDGDFIFKNGIGRTDLGGSIPSMRDSLTKMLDYPDDIILYPGHGPTTILKDEKENFKTYL
jgi:glyoxylase-like metal-dependent hydrolase (beta-lactamase superfamily II)